MKSRMKLKSLGLIAALMISLGGYSQCENDTETPVIDCPNDTVLINSKQACRLVVRWDNPDVTDNCEVESVTSTHESGDLYDVGVTPVTYYAVDKAGNEDSCSFSVEIKDTLLPYFITCPSDTLVLDTAGKCGMNVTWKQVLASDNCSGFKLTSTHQQYDFFEYGTTEVVYTIEDKSGNKANCSFSVTVNDEYIDEITCGSDKQVFTDSTCSATVGDYLNSVIYFDRCKEEYNLVQSPVDGTRIGENTVVEITATDLSGNTSKCSFNVVVVDNIKPSINCAEDVITCDPFVTFDAATATDNCSDVTIEKIDESGFDSGMEFPLGQTDMVYQAKDASGNSSVCKTRVIVKNKPYMEMPGTITTDDLTPVVIDAIIEDAVEIDWEPASSLDDPTLDQPEASPQQTTTYYVTALSALGCSIEDSVQVKVNVVSSLTFTNAISPNNDGVNDYWIMNKPQLIDGCKTIILDPSGKNVFETTEYRNDWNGEYKGKQLPEGTYYFFVRCDKEASHQGTINIIR